MGIPRFARLLQRTAWLQRHRADFTTRCCGDKRRLLIDISVISQRDAQTGIQRVVRAVWSELSRLQSSLFEVVPVFASSAAGYCEAPVGFLETGRRQVARVPVKVRPNDVFLGLDLSAQLLPDYRRQLRAWRRAGASINIVAYDLLPLMRGDFFDRRTVSNFKRWFEFVARDSDQVFCISRQVGRDVRERLRQLDRFTPGTPAIRYLQMGSDISASRPSAGIGDDVRQLLDRMRFRPTILLVGTVEPRKGYDVALDAFEYLWGNRGGDAPDMVIVGKPGWKTRPLQRRLRSHPEHGRRLHWLTSVSDEGLCRLYEASRGLLMASQAEGFGLPLIEAASHRRYVLARDLPVFREQNLPNASFFEDDDPQVLGQQILELSLKGLHPSPPAVLPTWSDSVHHLVADLGLQLSGQMPRAATEGGVRVES